MQLTAITGCCTNLVTFKINCTLTNLISENILLCVANAARVEQTSPNLRHQVQSNHHKKFTYQIQQIQAEGRTNIRFIHSLILQQNSQQDELSQFVHQFPQLIKLPRLQFRYDKFRRDQIRIPLLKMLRNPTEQNIRRPQFDAGFRGTKQKTSIAISTYDDFTNSL
jgi:hypothetical protein